MQVQKSFIISMNAKLAAQLAYISIRYARSAHRKYAKRDAAEATQLRPFKTDMEIWHQHWIYERVYSWIFHRAVPQFSLQSQASLPSSPFLCCSNTPTSYTKGATFRRVINNWSQLVNLFSSTILYCRLCWISTYILTRENHIFEYKNLPKYHPKYRISLINFW